MTIIALFGGLLTLVLAFAEKIAFAVIVLLLARAMARTARRWQARIATRMRNVSQAATATIAQLVTISRRLFGTTTYRAA